MQWFTNPNVPVSIPRQSKTWTGCTQDYTVVELVANWVDGVLVGPRTVLLE